MVTVTTVNLGDIAVDVVMKDIKNIHLSVYPPFGKVRVSAPLRMNIDTIRIFAISKLGWIKKQQQKLQAQERESPREYLNRESHYLWGKRYLLQILEANTPPRVELKHTKILLQIRPSSIDEKKQVVLYEWYRKQLKKASPPLIEKWSPLLGVEVKGFRVRKMKTRWGSCTPKSGTILLNLELAKKPKECLEYIIVHEMLHLLEPTHNNHFLTLLSQAMPKWQFYRDELNKLPVTHEKWTY
jgi:predicted metal-dependent hydrolase